MKQVKRSVLLWYSPRQMYDLVTDVAAYPRFLPWCERAEVLEDHETEMLARLHLSYAGVRQSFTTRNTQVPGESVLLNLVDGPFTLLEGLWRFAPVGPEAQASRVDFDMRYAFSSGPLEKVLSPVFDRVANTFVDSFVKRAEQVHGPR